MSALLRAIPIRMYDPLRERLLRYPRGSFRRNLCVVALKLLLQAHRGHLAERLTEVRPLDKPDVSFQPTDSMVINSIYWFGLQGYEGIVGEVWEALCATSSAVIEIGGNVGVFTVVGGRIASGSYTVVEPVPAVADILAANLRRNGLRDVSLLQAAAVPSFVPCAVSLSIPTEGREAPVGAHLLEGVEILGRSSMITIEVQGLPFQALIEGKTLIKIDAEGVEAELLRSASEALTANRPTLLIEVLPEAAKLGRLLADLATHAGYTLHILPEFGSETVVTVEPSQFTSALPALYHSKDVLLHVGPLPKSCTGRSFSVRVHAA